MPVPCKQVCAGLRGSDQRQKWTYLRSNTRKILVKGLLVELARFHRVEKCSSVTVSKLSSLLQRVSMEGLLRYSHTSIIISSVLSKPKFATQDAAVMRISNSAR